MSRVRIFCALFCVLVVSSLSAQSSLKKPPLAATPPMGWNSWDAYGFTIDEKDFKANAEVLASMRPLGWEYAVIDEGWYMQDPFGKDTPAQKFLFDGNGLLIPDVSRFPSAAGNAGFRPLSDWLHSKGLKFGIHILRGVPREVADKNLPIADSSFHMSDAVDRESTCPWSDANYGIADNAAGQAYYDSMMKRYAHWGLDFIKVDCISDRPFRPTEIRQIAEAIRKTGRPIVLSLSPGPTSLDNADYVAKYSQMWRITDDHWDYWMAKDKGQGSEFPFGLKEEFDRIASWNKHVKPGAWPDPDMLPLGSLTPHPGFGDPRASRYTPDEERSEFTLWAISRSPLIFGGNLTKLDDFTRSLLTNKDVLDINQRAVESGPVLIPGKAGLPSGWHAWSARTKEPNGKTYIALFNASDNKSQWEISWTAFHLSNKDHALYDLYSRKEIPAVYEFRIELPPHGCALYRVE
ncbi:MAG TPA: glycoside hydrolase family 27 protein [Terracidiphilus sp.]|jgi:hypothetical protein